MIGSLLLRRDCCTFSNGEYVKAGLAELELWCCQAKEEVLIFVLDRLSYCTYYLAVVKLRNQLWLLCVTFGLVYVCLWKV